MDTREWFQACEEGDFDTIKKMLNTGFDVNCKDDGGRTALCYATFAGAREMVDLLLQEGYDCNILDKEGHDALSYADIEGHHDLLPILNRI